MQSEETIRVFGDNQEDVIRWYFEHHYYFIQTNLKLV